MENYKVRVEDIYHQGYIDDSYYLKEEFPSYKEAENFCKKFLDNDLVSILENCKTKDDFYGYWSFHGEALYISPSSKENDFNSRDYIEEQINKHFNN